MIVIVFSVDEETATAGGESGRSIDTVELRTLYAAVRFQNEKLFERVKAIEKKLGSKE